MNKPLGLVGVEPQGAGNSEHNLRRRCYPSLFQPGVVVGADGRQPRDLLAAQPRHATDPERISDADLLRCEARPPGTEEVAEYGW